MLHNVNISTRTTIDINNFLYNFLTLYAADHNMDLDDKQQCSMAITLLSCEVSHRLRDLYDIEPVEEETDA